MDCEGCDFFIEYETDNGLCDECVELSRIEGQAELIGDSMREREDEDGGYVY